MLMAIALGIAAIVPDSLSVLCVFPRVSSRPHQSTGRIYSSDLLAFLVPTPTLLIGQPSTIASLAQRLVAVGPKIPLTSEFHCFLVILDYGGLQMARTESQE